MFGISQALDNLIGSKRQTRCLCI